MSQCKSLASSSALLIAMSIVVSGCLSVKAPEQINVSNRPHRIDSSRVPPTRDHEDARQKLAEAYDRNRYLENKVAELEREKDELEDERDEYKRRYEQVTD